MKRGPRPGAKFKCGTCGQAGHTARTHNGRTVGQNVDRIKEKARNLRSHYRLGWADYLALLDKGCGICRRDLHRRTPDVDHDHDCEHPGKGTYCCRACVRGLLCRSCNLRVGAYERGRNSDQDIRVYLGRPQVTAQTYTQESLFPQDHDMTTTERAA
jgi:hypothetical protein